MKHGRSITILVLGTSLLTLCACAVVPTEHGGAVVGVHLDNEAGAAAQAGAFIQDAASQFLPPPWGAIVGTGLAGVLGSVAVYQRRRGERQGWDEAEAERRARIERERLEARS